MNGTAIPSTPTQPTSEVAPGTPWILPILVGLSLIAVGTFGIEPTCRAASIGLGFMFGAFLLRHFAFAVVSLRAAPNEMFGSDGIDTGFRPTVTVMVPCHNEEVVIAASVEAFLAIDYPRDKMQLICINDKSTDATGALLDNLAKRNPQLEVLHRPVGATGGKSGALNEALALATGEIIMVFDADHRPRADALLRTVRHFADPVCAATQGRCIIRNSSESSLTRTVSVDYFSGYIVNEYGRQALFDLPAYGGANCAVRTDVVRALGGWNVETVTEDTDLTLRVVLGGMRVRYDMTAIDSEEGVPSYRRFWKQRYRWARGHQQVWRDYRRYVIHAPGLTVAQRIETLMFLLVFHVPALCALGLGLLALRAVGLVPWGRGLEVPAFAALLFLGPLVELAAGLLVSKAPRQAAKTLLTFFPAFFAFTIICARSWLDGVIGRSYTWEKTQRTGHGLEATP